MIKILVYCSIPLLAKGVKNPTSRLIIVHGAVKAAPPYAAATAEWAALTGVQQTLPECVTELFSVTIIFVLLIFMDSLMEEVGVCIL